MPDPSPRIVAALTWRPRMSAAELCGALWIGTRELFAALHALERAGAVRSDWVPGERPRRRVYWVRENR